MTLQRKILTMASNGRVVIPSEMRAELGLLGGEKIIARIVDGALVLESIDASIRRAQAIAAKYAVAGISVVDELVAERRAEASRE